jgi:hypothetical protein
MQLNKSTYETIFLLYLDNELSPAEKLEVETFIAANPSYALEMEALKATVASPELIPYPFKENLKQQAEISSEALDKDWNQHYATILKADVDAMPGLSTSLKNNLKKVATKEGDIVADFFAGSGTFGGFLVVPKSNTSASPDPSSTPSGHDLRQ